MKRKRHGAEEIVRKLRDGIFGIRSPGRDGTPDSAQPYLVGPFLATDYDRDLLWADGYLLRYPAGIPTSQ